MHPYIHWMQLAHIEAAAPVGHAGGCVLGYVIVHATLSGNDFHIVRSVHNACVYGVVVAPLTALHCIQSYDMIRLCSTYIHTYSDCAHSPLLLYGLLFVLIALVLVVALVTITYRSCCVLYLRTTSMYGSSL